MSKPPKIDKFNAKLLGDWRGKTLRQIKRMICGEKLGWGAHRDVFVLKQNPLYVVKIERNPSEGMFSNVTEWRNYINNKEFAVLAVWLAPCEMINETGQILIQRRVSIDGRRRKDFPVYIPAIFTDTKYRNFGWIDDRFVCCDYPFFPLVMAKQNVKLPMKKARWWGSIKPQNTTT